MKKKKGAGARRAVCGVVRPRVLDRRHLIALRLALRVAGMGTIDLLICGFCPSVEKRSEGYVGEVEKEEL